ARREESVVAHARTARSRRARRRALRAARAGPLGHLRGGAVAPDRGDRARGGAARGALAQVAARRVQRGRRRPRARRAGLPDGGDSLNAGCRPPQFAWRFALPVRFRAMRFARPRLLMVLVMLLALPLFTPRLAPSAQVGAVFGGRIPCVTRDDVQFCRG